MFLILDSAHFQQQKKMSVFQISHFYGLENVQASRYMIPSEEGGHGQGVEQCCLKNYSKDSKRLQNCSKGERTFSSLHCAQDLHPQECELFMPVNWTTSKGVFIAPLAGHRHRM